MPTPPNLKDFETHLQKLHELSQAVLACEPWEAEKMQTLLNERESLISWLQNADRSALNPKGEPALNALLEQVKACDTQIAERFQETLNLHGEENRQLVKVRQVLAGYTFPTIPPA